MIQDNSGTARHLIMHNNILAQDNANVGVNQRHTNAAKPAPNTVGHMTRVEAQEIIKSRMLFNCLKESLMNVYLTSLTIVPPTMEEDGLRFL